MTKSILLLAAAGMALTACAAPQPTRAVFISGPGAHRYIHPEDGRNRVYVIRHGDGAASRAEIRAHARREAEFARRHAELARRHAGEARRMALLARPDPEVMARITREARAAGEAGRRAGEAGRLAGELARRNSDMARLRSEQARSRAAEIRREAERLRAQCERGEIQCEIIVTD